MDMIIYNAKILRKDGSFSEAIALKNGLIDSVGTNEEILKLKEPSTNCIDADNHLIIPGLNDSHQHLLMVGQLLQNVVLYGVTSIQELIGRGKHFIDTHKPEDGQFIGGMGWNQDYFTDEHRLPTRHDLDMISTTHPIVFRRACGHIMVCNSLTLQLAGIDENTPEVEGGQIDREENGYPTGIFRENASVYLTKLQKPETLEDIKKTILTAAGYAASKGLTSVQTNDVSSSNPNYEMVIQAYRELAEDGLLPVRVNLQCCFTEIESFDYFLNQGYTFGQGNSNFKIGPLKLFVDGSLGARTALMRNPYYDDPNEIGIRTLTQAQSDELVKRAQEHNFQVVVHAIGDGAIEQVLDSYQKVFNQADGNTLRHGIVHCQITDLPLLKRFQDMDVLALVQPIFLHYDKHIVCDRVGEKLASTSYAFKTMENLHLHVSYGTDAPVEDLNPFASMYCAITRSDLNQTEPFVPQECIDVQTAIYDYTVGSAYCSFEENDKGVLEVGQYADLILLDEDLFELATSQIKDVSPLLTIKGGSITYKA